MKKKKKIMVEIELDKLERIAEFYDFPVAIFWAPKSIFRKGKTRNQILQKKATAFDKIKKIIEEVKA